MPSPSIGIVYSFGRSGSTLLNQCLGCHPANAVLSEVNPATSCVNVAWQARHWLDLIPDNELREFSRLPYGQQVSELARKCVQQQRHLIVRDWSTINFLANVSACIEPSGMLEQELYLNREQLSLRRVVFTRRASAVFHSLRTRFPQYHDLSAEEFARGYFCYAESVHGFPTVHLEDFSVQPADWMVKICELLHVAYAENFLDKFADYHNCTGNIALAKDVSSKSLRTITPVVSSNAVTPHPLLIEADRLLGYETI